MLIYWLLFAIPAVASLAGLRAADTVRRSILPFALFWILYNLVSTLRFEIGGDWENYALMVEAVRQEPLEFALRYGDLAFNALVWLLTRAGFGIHAVNGLCSAILSWGVITVARRTPAPWLAIAAAVPYLLIVVGMGYIRQAAAIGLILLALANFADGRNLRAIAFMVLATLFHAAAAVMIPIIGLALARRSPVAMALVAIFGGAAASYALSDQRVEAFQIGYLEAGYDSTGTLVRLVTNAVPAVIFLWRRKAFRLGAVEEALWLGISLACIAAVAAFLISPSSTAVDRVALFFSPIQLFVFGFAPRVLQERGPAAILLILCLIGYFAAIQLVWLVGATHSEYWVPYRSLFDVADGAGAA